MTDLPTMTIEEVQESMHEVVCQRCKEYYYIDQMDVASDTGVCGLCEMHMISEDENDSNDLGQQADVAYHKHIDTQLERG